VVKLPGRGVDNPSPSSGKVQERVEVNLYYYFSSGPSSPVIERNVLFYQLLKIRRYVPSKRR
jgi:hypothetical protein